MKPVGKVDLRFERRVCILRAVRDDDVTENVSITDGEPLTDPLEKVSLALRRQVVNGQCADNQVESPSGNGSLQAADSGAPTQPDRPWSQRADRGRFERVPSLGRRVPRVQCEPVSFSKAIGAVPPLGARQPAGRRR